MEVIFVLIPVSLVIIGGAVWAFLWSVRNDQFEDLEKEAHSIFFDDEVESRGGDESCADDNDNENNRERRSR